MPFTKCWLTLKATTATSYSNQEENPRWAKQQDGKNNADLRGHYSLSLQTIHKQFQPCNNLWSFSITRFDMQLVGQTLVRHLRFSQQQMTLLTNIL